MLGSWPFEWNEPLYLEGKSIGGVHSHSLLGKRWGMAAALWVVVYREDMYSRSNIWQWLRPGRFGNHQGFPHSRATTSISTPSSPLSGAWWERYIYIYLMSTLKINPPASLLLLFFCMTDEARPRQPHQEIIELWNRRILTDNIRPAVSRPFFFVFNGPCRIYKIPVSFLKWSHKCNKNLNLH